jgi:phytoene synthase
MSDYQTALVECRQMIKVGSKSFSLASKIFGPEKRDAAFLLYGWCRYCDDLIDTDQVHGMGMESLEQKLKSLKARTLSAYRGEPQHHPVFIAFQHVVLRYAIPMHYPMELLEGMAMDVKNMRYADFEALTLYCYRVAGTVGLMMSHIMGVSSSQALRHAADLGIAMQLTNISRDVIEDAEKGRIYLPLDYLNSEGIVPAQLTQIENRASLSRVVRRILQAADVYYRSGDRGFPYLSVRCALAVSAARQIYSQIGRQVLRRGPRAWDSRTWVSPLTKLWVMSKGMAKIVGEIPARILFPWRPAALRVIWRHA